MNRTLRNAVVHLVLTLATFGFAAAQLPSALSIRQVEQSSPSNVLGTTLQFGRLLVTVRPGKRHIPCSNGRPNCFESSFLVETRNSPSAPPKVILECIRSAPVFYPSKVTSQFVLMGRTADHPNEETVLVLDADGHIAHRVPRSQIRTPLELVDADHLIACERPDGGTMVEQCGTFDLNTSSFNSWFETANQDQQPWNGSQRIWSGESPNEMFECTEHDVLRFRKGEDGVNKQVVTTFTRNSIWGCHLLPEAHSMLLITTALHERFTSTRFLAKLDSDDYHAEFSILDLQTGIIRSRGRILAGEKGIYKLARQIAVSPSGEYAAISYTVDIHPDDFSHFPQRRYGRHCLLNLRESRQVGIVNDPGKLIHAGEKIDGSGDVGLTFFPDESHLITSTSRIRRYSFGAAQVISRLSTP